MRCARVWGRGRDRKCGCPPWGVGAARCNHWLSELCLGDAGHLQCPVRLSSSRLGPPVRPLDSKPAELPSITRAIVASPVGRLRWTSGASYRLPWDGSSPDADQVKCAPPSERAQGPERRRRLGEASIVGVPYPSGHRKLTDGKHGMRSTLSGAHSRLWENPSGGRE